MLLDRSHRFVSRKYCAVVECVRARTRPMDDVACLGRGDLRSALCRGSLGTEKLLESAMLTRGSSEVMPGGPSARSRA